MKVTRLLLILIPALFIFCGKHTDKKNNLVQINGIVLDRDQFEAFQKVTRFYPSKMNAYFPGSRPLISFMVETQVLYNKAKWDFGLKAKSKNLDWKWKSCYYPAQLFIFDFLSSSLGVTDRQISSYYNSHKESFKTTLKKDALGKNSPSKDSTYFFPLADVKGQIIDSLFLSENKPDSAFIKSLGPSSSDNMVIRNSWLMNVRNNLPQFFMKKYFNEKYGHNYPDSLNEVYGKGKVITPEDLKVILSWVPEERRGYYNNPQGTRELVEWLIKWKLFSEQAKKTGFAYSKPVRNVIEWAWKIDLATAYLEKNVLQNAKASTSFDTSMARYAYYDDIGVIETGIDSLQNFKLRLASISDNIISDKVDSFIFQIRKNNKVKFLQNDYTDSKTEDPVAMLKKADSLRDTGAADAAERLYNSLSSDFFFSPEGKKATVELAKIQTEKQLYYQAVKNYRKVLLSEPSNQRCNLFFMIGFIYDEYLDKSDLAEVNYKWVLKNEPGCELADDAEFMMLHLNEPMTSVEELQAEALRQGRKVEPAGEDTLSMQSDSVSKK